MQIEQIINLLPDPLFIVTNSGSILYTNNRAKEILKTFSYELNIPTEQNIWQVLEIQNFDEIIKKNHVHHKLEKEGEKLILDFHTLNENEIVITGKLLSTEIALASKVTSLVEIVTATCLQLEMSGQLLFQSATNTEEQANNLKNETDSIYSFIEEIKNAMKEMHLAITEISQRTHETVIESNTLINQSLEVKDALVSLKEASNQIDEIVTTIQSISSETKLLSLNARIEAAKAGRFGAGFAVVANEIKNLSNDSKCATANISEKIIEIQHTADMFSSMIDMMNGAIDNITSSYITISSAVEEQSVVTSDISNRSSALFLRVEEITKDLSHLLTNAQTSQDSSQNMQDSITHLSANSMDLNECVKQFLKDLYIIE